MLDLLGEVPDEEAADLPGTFALQQSPTQEEAGNHRIVVLERRRRGKAQRRRRQRLQQPVGEAVDQPAKAVEGKTVPAHRGEQASMLAGVAAFLEEQALQILAQPGIGAIEMVAAGADDEAFTLGNQQGVGVEELGRERPAAKPRAARG